MKLIPQPPGIYESGQILFNGRDLVPLTDKEMSNYLRSFGSRASRKPSPTALNAKIVSEINTAGKIMD